MEFFLVIGIIGILIFIGVLVLPIIGQYFLDMDDDKINFSIPLFIISGVVTFLVILGGWALFMITDYDSYGDCIKSIYWWKKVGFACLIVPTIVCLLPNFLVLIGNLEDDAELLLFYSILMLIVSGCSYFLLNIALNNYVGESGFVLFFAIAIFIVLLLLFIPYNSARERWLKQKTKKRIQKISAKITKAIFEIDSIKHMKINRSVYNKTRKKVNRVLLKRNVYQTFQPIFNEDLRVLKVISFMDTISDAKLMQDYKKYKSLFHKENSFKLLEKGKKDEPSYDEKLKNFSELLKGTIEKNKTELQKVDTGLNCIELYKKYGIAYQDKDVRNKFIRYSILFSALLILLISGNVFLKRHQEQLVSKNFGKDIEGYELIDKKEIWDDTELYAEIKNDKLQYYSYDHGMKGDGSMVRTYNEGIFAYSEDYYKGDKLSKWENLKTIEPVDEGRREKSLLFWVRGLIGLRNDGRILLSNEEKKWFDISRYDLYVGLYYNETTGKYFGLKVDGELVQLNKK